MQKIIFNGKEYNSLNEMPPDTRRAYEAAMGQVSSLFDDKNRDGVPDIFENFPTGKTQNMQVFTTSKVIMDGQAYDHLSDMPPEVQQKYKQAFEDKNQDGIPDMLENMGQMSQTSVVGKVPQTPLPPLAMQPESASPLPWLILAGGVIVVLLVVIAGLVYLLLT